MEDLYAQLIIQFLQGELDGGEAKKLGDWRAISVENEKQFQEVKFLWEKTKLTQPIAKGEAIDVDAALKKVHHQLPTEAKVVPLRRRIIQIAGVAALVLFAASFWFFNSNRPEMVKVKTLANEQKKISLPDESIVWLNENSELTYPSFFAKNKREVSMNGDLVFEVKPNSSKPFNVKTNDLSVQVLGTKFNVNSYKQPTDKRDNKNSFVHVLYGKVSVQKDDAADEVILKKGMTAVLDENDKLSLRDDFSANRLFWLNKTLEFDHTPLAEVFADLEAVFKVKLEVENPDILNCKFSGRFEKDISPDKLLDMMRVIFKLTIEKKNPNHFKIKNGTC